jgi:hypothetical protein
LSLIRANSLCELILSASHRRHADFREFTNQIAKELVTAVITCDFRSLAITPATEDNNTHRPENVNAPERVFWNFAVFAFLVAVARPFRVFLAFCNIFISKSLR